ncbi:hypothetical protein MLD38_025582 [Melastoma candidum]|uniref:Uncharacterized protein n=1 Tax=Melastoma candidum TaxID=119954 RepID=A0ACB9P2Q2_9MYRT|nr:hypothetical protein MLD38_025582 [Melastoma candidum]
MKLEALLKTCVAAVAFGEAEVCCLQRYDVPLLLPLGWSSSPVATATVFTIHTKDVGRWRQWRSFFLIELLPPSNEVPPLLSSFQRILQLPGSLKDDFCVEAVGRQNSSPSSVCHGCCQDIFIADDHLILPKFLGQVWRRVRG